MTTATTTYRAAYDGEVYPVEDPAPNALCAPCRIGHHADCEAEAGDCTHLCHPVPMLHRHDLGITISVGDLQPAQLAAVRRILEGEVAAMVDRVNVETAALTGEPVGWYVSYDGSRECGQHR